MYIHFIKTYFNGTSNYRIIVRKATDAFEKFIVVRESWAK